MPESIFKPNSFIPLTGPLDARSSADEKAPGSFAWKENVCVNVDGKLARAKGWKRAFDYPCVTNHDFHDQGVASEDREPMTLLFPSTAASGQRRLFGSTKTRILVLDEATGTWTTLGSGFGNDGGDNLTQIRFKAAELKDKVFFTNNVDLVQYHELGSGTLQAVPNLASAIFSGAADANVSKAKVIISWNGVILLMNTVEDVGDGPVSQPSRIRWSDLNDGLDWGQATNSISDFQDLDYGHVILGAVPIGSSLYVFCDRSIWRCNFTVNPDTQDTSLDALRVYYEPRNKAKCLAYPNSLISDGRTAYYLGADDLYLYTPGYTPEPESTEWLHRSTSIIFSGANAIDQRSCQSPIAEYKTRVNEIHFSWPIYDLNAEVIITPNCQAFVPTSPVSGSGINRKTLVVNPKYKTCDFRDYGSTAMTNFTTDFAGIGQCNQESALLAVNGDDWTIKQLEIGYGREMYDAEASGYTLEGYFSTLRLIFPFARFLDEKEINSFLSDLVPEDPADTAAARLRIGTSDRALDPNAANGNCGVIWHRMLDKPIKCSYTMTPEQYVARNIRPKPAPVSWSFLYRGIFLYVELTIAAADTSAPTTGGCTISRFDVTARVL